MTAKEYLGQAYRLDQKINGDIRRKEELRALSESLGSPGFEQRCNPNRPTEAPFVRRLERVWEMEKAIDDEIDLLVDLKAQISAVLAKVRDPDERMVLTCRYLRGMTWEQIADEVQAGRTTVYRRHVSGLEHVALPENPITI